MDKLFELPELLTLQGDVFDGLNADSVKGPGCVIGCESGCAAGCDTGGGYGKKPQGNS